MNIKREDMILYAVTDRSWLGEETLYQQVEKALKGGATFLQLREKQLDQEAFLQEALEMKKLCQAYHVPFVINDNVSVAAAADADGVHVGQDDMSVSDVRAKLGAGKIIGVSVHNVQEALEAERNGADYLGTGAVFPTGTKNNTTALSYDVLKEICTSVSIPVVAIGGITKDNLMQLKGSGIDGIAVVSAVFGCSDIEKGTHSLKEKVLEMLERGRS